MECIGLEYDCILYTCMRKAKVHFCKHWNKASKIAIHFLFSLLLFRLYATLVLLVTEWWFYLWDMTFFILTFFVYVIKNHVMISFVFFLTYPLTWVQGLWVRSDKMEVFFQPTLQTNTVHCSEAAELLCNGIARSVMDVLLQGILPRQLKNCMEEMVSLLFSFTPPVIYQTGF